jgi:superfamily II DNA or RNA helicase
MDDAAAPMVDAVEILRLVGQGSFERGRVYARNGAVQFVGWDPGTRVLTGEVLGTGPLPYVCTIILSPAVAKAARPEHSVCSCPMAFDCKHVAATLLFSNTSRVNKAAGTAATPAPAAPGWKSALGALTGEAEASDGRIAKNASMGLLFELREQVLSARNRWTGPTARTAAAPIDLGATYRLAVRPVAQSATGNWVRGNLTWNSLPYQLNRLELDPSQHRWFSQFAALHRSARDLYATGQETDWLYLDDFHSPLLWRLLDNATALDIPFVTGKKDTNVLISGTAAVSIDATIDGGDVRLVTQLTIGDTAVPLQNARSISDHGVYAFDLEPRPSFTLAALPSDLARMLGEPAMTIVPATDVDEFMHDYYPRLRSIVSVSSADGSVEFPEILPPVYVGTATFSAKQTLSMSWAWEGVGTLPGVVDEVMRVLGSTPTTTRMQGIGAAEFADKTLPRLEELAGVRIDIVGERPDYTELTDVPVLRVTTVETTKRDWFDLGVMVSIDGRSIPFAPLFKALSSGAKKLLLVDNSYMTLDHPAFDELRRLIDEAGELSEWETGLKISRYQADLWAELEELADETEQAVTWRASVGGLMNIASVESTPLPAGVQASLRPYQQEGFDWLAFLWNHQLGGILADDMGLGKTLQTLALVSHAVDATPVEHRRPFLVVAPTSVVSNWVAEAARFAPGLRVHAITATELKSRVPVSTLIAGADIVVTSYALFRIDFAAYQGAEWAGLILDEAQFVKNRSSKAHQCAVELDAPFKLAITGTPMENSLMDLWSLFHIVAPGLFPSGTRFTEDYIKPIVGGEKPELLVKLRRRIRPLMMRRTKDLVASELPAKQEQTLRVDLSPKHRKLYDAFLQKERQKLLGLIDDMDKNRFIVFRSLTLLRMLSLDASLVDEKYADIPSSKLDVLFEQLEDVIAEGHRALIFSQFTSFLGKAAERLTAQGIDFEYLDGSTLRRGDVIERFKKGTAPAFLISLKAGGFGLNLTEADYVFLLDPWWNPATESQAVDRTHRIGQTKSVMVYRMVANGTIEEKVMALKDQKAKLFDAVMDDDAVFSSALTADDIRALLEG